MAKSIFLYALSLAIISCQQPSYRAEISGVKGKEVNAARAIEEYYKGNGKLPFDAGRSTPWIMELPANFKIAYNMGDGRDTDWFQKHKHRFSYGAISATQGLIISPGPDGVMQINEQVLSLAAKEGHNSLALSNITYDPTNGIISNGDIFRSVDLWR